MEQETDEIEDCVISIQKWLTNLDIINDVSIEKVQDEGQPATIHVIFSKEFFRQNEFIDLKMQIQKIFGSCENIKFSLD